MASIEIRPAEDWDECLQCEEVQKSVWLSPDGRDVVPASLLITVQKNGGLLLGAFDGPRMVGFVFGFPGFTPGAAGLQLKHCSHQLGVLSEYRGRGLGYELKKTQREYLLEQKISLATWTYDPLQALNAQLNVSRLGGLVHRYLRDAYGEMNDHLNVGVSSDRFEVEWWLNSHRVRSRIESKGPPTETDLSSARRVYEVEFDRRGLVRVSREVECAGDVCWVEIPTDFNLVKSVDLELARKWRSWTRSTFESAFAVDYAVFDVRTWDDEAGLRRSAYILKKLAGPFDGQLI